MHRPPNPLARVASRPPRRPCLKRSGSNHTGLKRPGLKQTNPEPPNTVPVPPVAPRRGTRRAQGLRRADGLHGEKVRHRKRGGHRASEPHPANGLRRPKGARLQPAQNRPKVPPPLPKMQPRPKVPLPPEIQPRPKVSLPPEGQPPPKAPRRARMTRTASRQTHPLRPRLRSRPPRRGVGVRP